MTVEYYKGFGIDRDLFGDGFTVQYCGDDLVFATIAEAKAFIDSVSD